MKPNLLKNADGSTKFDWADPELNWLEWHLQAAMAQVLGRLERSGLDFTYAADQSGLSSSKGQAAIAKAAGMKEGEPDLRLYLPGPRLVLVEVKRGARAAKGGRKGRISIEQKFRREKLEALGFEVRTVWPTCPADAINIITELMRELTES
jgi:hypothetical protein